MTKQPTQKLEETSENKPERNEKGQLLPGNTANPNGRPQGTFSLKDILRAELQKMPEGEDEKTYAHKIIDRMIKDATDNGDDQKLKLIWNYIEGMPQQKVDVTTQGEKIEGFNFIKPNETNDNPNNQTE